MMRSKARIANSGQTNRTKTYNFVNAFIVLHCEGTVPAKPTSPPKSLWSYHMISTVRSCWAS
jgi:hypothetical protein